MKRRMPSHHYLLILALVCLTSWNGRGEEPLMKAGQRLAIVGDSITEQKLYSRYIELYLLCCQPQLKARVMQFGWGGERASGFLRRMENDLGQFAPEFVTTCYGMNDGSYRAYTEEIGKAYGDPMREIVTRLKEAGATVVVGSPGVVDSTYFKRDTAASVYNDNLAQLRDIAREIAKEHGMPFANVHDTMMGAMVKAKAELGDAYDVGGRDGVHPRPNGHLAMAHAFLKALGFDGDLGNISIDFTGEATAVNGHRVLGAKDGEIRLESSRYPFCFTGPPSTSEGTRSILPFLPFNEELNRLTLTVRNLPAESAEVTWGDEAKVFSKEQLETGINLAAEFLDSPLAVAFSGVERAVAVKQAFETTMIKQHITNHATLGTLFPEDAEVKGAVETLAGKLWQRQEELARLAAEMVKPVEHSLVVKPITP